MNTRCKISILILPPFFHSLTWKLLRLLLVFYFFGAFVGIVVFFFVNIALNVAQVFGFGFVFVFFANLNSIDLSSWMALLATSMTLVFLRRMGWRLIYISKQKFVKLSFIFVPMLVLLTGFLFFFLANGLSFFGYLKSIFPVSKGDCRLAFAFISTTFSTTSSHKSRLYFR